MGNVRRRARPWGASLASFVYPGCAWHAISGRRSQPSVTRARRGVYACSTLQHGASTTEQFKSQPGSGTTESSSHIDAKEESLRLLEWGDISAKVATYASTDLGRAALGNGICLPIPDNIGGSERLLQETREAYAMEYRFDKPLSFQGVFDIRSYVRSAAKGQMLSGMELLHIARTLAAARKIRKLIETVNAQTEGDTLKRFAEMVARFRTWPDVETRILQCIDEYGSVSDVADQQLAGIRQAQRQLVAEIRAKLNEVMASNSDAIQERVITTRYDRFVIMVKMAKKAVFRGGIVHDVSASGGTAFIEPSSVRTMNDKLREYDAKEKARVNAILRKLSADVVAPILDDAVYLADILAIIDAANARARCARALDAIDITFDDTQPLTLRGVRHPLLMWNIMNHKHDVRELEKYNAEQRVASTPSGRKNDIEKTEDATNSDIIAFERPQPPLWKKLVVPSTYELGKDVRCVCVTGPNTGGKTLCLKTLGVVALMAKAGLFVPASLPHSLSTAEGEETSAAEAVRIPYFDQVLADIGDDQSLVQSLSTFSGHIQRIKRILAATTERSLVLFDEIGSGTVSLRYFFRHTILKKDRAAC